MSIFNTTTVPVVTTTATSTGGQSCDKYNKTICAHRGETVVLSSTYKPDQWKAITQYYPGDIVDHPTLDIPYVYVAQNSGTSDIVTKPIKLPVITQEPASCILSGDNTKLPTYVTETTGLVWKMVKRDYWLLRSEVLKTVLFEGNPHPLWGGGQPVLLSSHDDAQAHCTISPATSPVTVKDFEIKITATKDLTFKVGATATDISLVKVDIIGA
jgi:hypothetical protein